MYEDHFNLRQCPFDHTPDPKFLVSTRRHNEALATLYYGVRKHKGLIALTGEVGTGKTLLLRCLLDLLADSEDISCSYVFTPPLKKEAFLQSLLLSLGLPVIDQSETELKSGLYQFLLAEREKHRTTVLIMDEAHLLSHDVLEEVRLLSNYETTDDKLLQIVLSGQPEFDDLLDSRELRQLKQRIVLRARLGALTLDETRQYVAARLKTAAKQANGDPVFPEETVVALFRHSRGLPRIINTLCENSLIGAYALQLQCISPELVAEVARDFRIDEGEEGSTSPTGAPSMRSEGGALFPAGISFGEFSSRSIQKIPEYQCEGTDSLQKVSNEQSI